MTTQTQDFSSYEIVEIQDSNLFWLYKIDEGEACVTLGSDEYEVRSEEYCHTGLNLSLSYPYIQNSEKDLSFNFYRATYTQQLTDHHVIFLVRTSEENMVVSPIATANGDITLEFTPTEEGSITTVVQMDYTSSFNTGNLGNVDITIRDYECYFVIPEPLELPMIDLSCQDALHITPKEWLDQAFSDLSLLADLAEAEISEMIPNLCTRNWLENACSQLSQIQIQDYLNDLTSYLSTFSN